MAREILVLAATHAFGRHLVERLRRDGFPACHVSDLEEAIRTVREVAVPMVVAEASLPDEDEKIRSRILSARPGCRVMFLSSFERLKSSGNLLRDAAENYVLREGDLPSLIHGNAEPSVAMTTRKEALTKVLDLVVSLAEAGDQYFAGFTNQVVRLAGAIADEMQIDPPSREDIVVASLVRDIGKAGIRDEVVQQRDTLSPEEVEHMRQHVLWSVRLIEHIDFGGKVIPLVRHHHERYDGTGYPDGLKGRQIPVGARIIAVAEAFAAMISDRPHRRSRSVEEALDEMMAKSGTQFDPEIVEALTKALRSTSSADLAGRRVVLIVDPEKESRRLLRMRLLNEGYEVFATGEMSEQYARNLSKTPNIIVFDASGGGKEAIEWLIRLRENIEGPPVPFALMVSDDDPGVKMRALEHGVDDILVKSSSLQEIVARIKNILIREAARSRHLHGVRSVGVSGALQNFPLSDIAQMLAMGQKTAQVTLNGPDRSGNLWFRDGKLIHADDGVQTGAVAFRHMLEWNEAEFLIQHGKAPETESMEVDPMTLLLEHFSLVDEVSHQIDDGLTLNQDPAVAVNE